ncbi:MAG TPA: SRPBCC family protein [Aliidongia sp.]|nr:SRPBCC family protein [Aliidongia sp.]
MVPASEAKQSDAALQPAPLRLSRVLHARRETVFKAWSTAEHVKSWFSPASYTVPEAIVEMEVGGRFEVCMRAPTGERHWTRGRFVEVVPLTRLVIDMHAVDGAGKPLFRAYTEVNFSDAPCGTQLDVVQTYTFIDPSMAAPMVAGAPEGWRTTLEKLEKEVVRMQGGSETGVRSVVHATFHLERTYSAPVARVWQALTDVAAKQRWFGGTGGRWELIERQMDVRVGGRERLKGRWEGGIVSTFDAVYHDVIPNQRLVYTYEMHLDDKKISVSLATMQLQAEGGKTTLMVTEQGAFLDGYDDAGSREHGTGHLLDALGASLVD